MFAALHSLARHQTALLAGIAALTLAGCSTTPVDGLLPDLNPPQRAMLTPDQQQEMIKQMAARKAAQEQLIAIETGSIKH